MLHGELKVTRQPAISPPLAVVTMTAAGSAAAMTRSYSALTDAATMHLPAASHGGDRSHHGPVREIFGKLGKRSRAARHASGYAGGGQRPQRGGEFPGEEVHEPVWVGPAVQGDQVVEPRVGELAGDPQVPLRVRAAGEPLPHLPGTDTRG